MNETAVLAGPAIRADHTEVLREYLRQTEMSGAGRRALLVHFDRFSAALSKPHYFRLAREALNPLLAADRAQAFDLRRGRVAIVWRERGGDELSRTLAALEHLLAGQQGQGVPPLGELITLFDLPTQAMWLLDELIETEKPYTPLAQPLELGALGKLETALARADLSPYARWRPVVRLLPAGPPGAVLSRIETEPVWDERYFASYALEEGLELKQSLKADPWLFGRLSRMLDRRMLAMLGGPGELRQFRSLAITLNVSTILGAEFLRFDDLLPAHLRGQAILNLRPADILAAPRDFLFARSFLKARGYRLALTGTRLRMLQMLNLAAAGFDFVQIRPGPDLAGAPDNLSALVPQGTQLIAIGLDRIADLRWAMSHGVYLGMGKALAR